jgi:RNA polymerase sigma-70 factor (ECF subfamily)
MKKPPSNIDRLLLRRKDDDPLLAEIMVQEYFGYISRIAFSILGDLDDANDAAQEALIEAILHIERYQPGTNFRAWLVKIAYHKSLNILRKRRVIHSLMLSLRWLHSWNEAPRTADDLVEQTEADSHLWDCVNELGHKQRIPIILRYVYELPIKEIAEIIGVSEGTIHSRLHYAARKLKRKLEGKEYKT